MTAGYLDSGGLRIASGLLRPGSLHLAPPDDFKLKSAREHEANSASAPGPGACICPFLPGLGLHLGRLRASVPSGHY